MVVVVVVVVLVVVVGSGGSGSRVNDKPWAIMFARLKRPSATSRVRVHGSSSCREKKKREESVVQGVGLVYSPAQRRAKTKRRTPTSHDDGPLFRFLSFSLSISLSFSFPFFPPSLPPLSPVVKRRFLAERGPKHGSQLHKRVSFNNPVGRLNRRPDFSGSH